MLFRYTGEKQGCDNVAEPRKTTKDIAFHDIVLIAVDLLNYQPYSNCTVLT